MKFRNLLFVSLVGLLMAVPVQASDIEAGKAVADKVCSSCHGADGNSEIPTYPKLAGQYESYLKQALMDYRAGNRTNPIMAGFATTLSDDDINNVAAFFASQSGALKVLEN